MKSQDGPIEVYLCPDDTSSRSDDDIIDSKAGLTGLCLSNCSSQECVSPMKNSVSSSQDVSFANVTSSQPDNERLNFTSGMQRLKIN